MGNPCRAASIKGNPNPSVNEAAIRQEAVVYKLVNIPSPVSFSQNKRRLRSVLRLNLSTNPCTRQPSRPTTIRLQSMPIFHSNSIADKACECPLYGTTVTTIKNVDRILQAAKRSEERRVGK